MGMPRSITQVRSGFSVLLLDALQKVTRGGLVAGVPGHDLIGERKTFRGHDQGNHHLHAIRTFVAAVTEFPHDLLAVALIQNRCWSDRRGAPRTTTWNSACQRCRRYVKKIPAYAGSNLSKHRYSLSICTRPKSSPRDRPSRFVHTIAGATATRCLDRSSGNRPKVLEHIQPTGPLSTDRQSIRPKLIQPQLIPKKTGQPAGTPLPGTM